ncbi:MAG TPA: PQQ-dependent sugar dehydrogenase [Ramlibacter sp.]|jgi:glucose/arabinose dehydrogenase
MSKNAALTLACALLGTGLFLASTPPPAAAATPSADAPRLTRTVVLSGLQNPWDIAFTPDGVMLFTEKCRGLSARLPDGRTVRLFGTEGSAVVASDLFCQGQSGMHGIAVDPEFSKGKRDIYVFMASRLRTPATNRVVRLTLSADATSVSRRTDIVEDIAHKHVANGAGSAGAHSGGAVRFGPDGFLWITSGDNHNATLPQDLKRLGGKVLRVNRDGAAAPGNNTPAGGDPRIFTYGHRNVQGLTFRPAGQPGAGQPFTAEHGPNHSDEVTPLVAGGNAGWDPQKRPGLRCPDDYCGYAGDPATMPMTDTQRFPRAMPPSWVYNGDGRGMGTAQFLEGDRWKAWNGRLLVSMMRGQRIAVLQLDANGMAVANANVDLPSTRTRALVPGPDGSLYTANDDGEIWRVVPN